VRSEDSALRDLQALAQRETSLPPAQRIAMHFALAKSHEDLGRNETSFRHLLAGNALKRGTIVYDERQTLDYLRRIQAAFTAEAIGLHAGTGFATSQPVFIVGMPRSGSTLIEQLIASHPSAFGAGERGEFPAAVRAAGLEMAILEAPEGIAGTGDAPFARLGRAYLERLHEAVRWATSGSGEVRSPQSYARITDKMLGNLTSVGLIHLALPQARIIFARRDPVDTCLACFSKLFTHGQEFAYDLAELGRFYRAFSQMMEHWKAVLPPGVIIEVQYERLVQDFEDEARRLIAHCGLDWSPACLDFHRTERVVATASVRQVREPLYRSSVNRWRPDAATLRPLLDALACEALTP
jgi:hypothetical protein